MINRFEFPSFEEWLQLHSLMLDSTWKWIGLESIEFQKAVYTQRKCEWELKEFGKFYLDRKSWSEYDQ